MDFINVHVFLLFQGLGTDEYALIGLLCTRTNEELDAIKVAYKESMFYRHVESLFSLHYNSSLTFSGLILFEF